MPSRDTRVYQLTQVYESTVLSCVERDLSTIESLKRNIEELHGVFALYDTATGRVPNIWDIGSGVQMVIQDPKSVPTMTTGVFLAQISRNSSRVFTATIIALPEGLNEAMVTVVSYHVLQRYKEARINQTKSLVSLTSRIIDELKRMLE
ncbi:hypothetical protein PROFUN_14571 [Planoprotostelium fungivorum]|uniref:Uncharacterized protein n=1 Tax=Planoprotostelium fungivorum TaxID=1890364 RepID=A0A2P6MZA4_9EUKA|nr:hypothetical protein PROFUN_14571 [Planoprotostelium fungivorum]